MIVVPFSLLRKNNRGQVSSGVGKRFTVVALSIFLAFAAMFRDPGVLNSGRSVSVGFYIASDPADAAESSNPLEAVRHHARITSWQAAIAKFRDGFAVR